MSTLYTHVFPDKDAAASVWCARRYMPGLVDAEVVFKSAGWDGAELPPFRLGMDLYEAIAVDMHAGGHGIKGDDDHPSGMSSAFAYLMRNFAPPEDQDALKHVIRYIDLGDATGTVLGHFPQLSEDEQIFLGTCSLSAVFDRFTRGKDWSIAIDWMAQYLEGELAVQTEKRLLPEVAERCTKIGRVAILDNERVRPSQLLYEKYGMRAVVYKDEYNLGIVRLGNHEERWPTANDFTLAVVEEAEELDEWYVDPRGFLFSRGSDKNRMTTPSNVQPILLVKALNRYLDAEDPR